MKQKRYMIGVLFFCVLSFASVSTIAAAAETADADAAKPQGWDGEVELGYVQTTGNSETRTANLGFKALYLRNKWSHEIKASGFQSTDRGTTTAERIDGRYRAEYKWHERDYLFGSFRYEDDPFAGYEPRTTQVVGYGYAVLVKPTLKLDVEGGVGARQTRGTNGVDTDEGILRGALKFLWKISETSEFTQDLSVEAGDENTVTESNTALKLKINSVLGVRLALNIQNNSKVPDGIEKTDTKSTVSLVYDF
jgi:putative salt-induced outer membrane protein